MSFILLGILNSQAEAAGGAGAYDLLESTVLTSSASSVSFTGLDSYTDYKHLQIRVTGRSTTTNSNAPLVIRLNGDSGSNYTRHNLIGDGSSVSSLGFANTSSMLCNKTFPGQPATSSIYGAAVLDFLDFSSSTKNTTMRVLQGVTSNASNSTAINLDSGLYANTSAVTSITLSTSSDIATGSRFSLYGIR